MQSAKASMQSAKATFHAGRWKRPRGKEFVGKKIFAACHVDSSRQDVAAGKGNSHRRQMTVCVPFVDYLGGSRQRFFLYLFIYLFIYFWYKNSLPTV
jgi:hypothetical protein